MNLPFSSLQGDHYEIGLVMAVAIGFFFGFALERAGFGRATKLAGQFYLRDMTVFKVMFSAIVFAMLGLVAASGLGWIDLRALSESAASPTYLWPMIAGGLLLGAGFIISGYCPGTSMVATASGHLDGAVTFLGVIVGSVVYGEIQPLFENFHYAGDLGHFFLYDLLDISPIFIAMAVLGVAILGFMGAEAIESWITTKKSIPKEPSQPSTRRLAWASLSVFFLVAGASQFIGATPKGQAAQALASPISPAQLAKRLVDEPWSLRIIDLRETQACAQKRIEGSECIAQGELNQLGLAFSPAAKDLVVLAQGDLDQVPSAALAYPGRVLALAGGFSAWQRYALDKPVAPGPQASQEVLEAYRFQSALNQALTGAPPPPPPAKVQKFTPKKKRKGGGCS